jgi:predicted alpha/beta hydrolase
MTSATRSSAARIASSRFSLTKASYHAPVRREPFSVVCDDGWRLGGELLTPESPLAVVVLGHAMLVDRRSLRRLAEHLAARGLAVIWADLRGHGDSGPLAALGGRWSYDDLVERDTPALLDFASRRYPSLSLAALGHSLFGHVVLARLGRHPASTRLDALVLLASNIQHPGWPLSLARLRKRFLVELMGAVSSLVGYVPARRLRVGSADESLDYARQMVGWTRSLTWAARDGFDYWAAMPSVSVPVLSIAAAGDRTLAPPPEARSLVRPVPGAVFEIAGRSSGLSFDPGHMALGTDERCAPVWDRAVEFILAAGSRRGATREVPLRR